MGPTFCCFFSLTPPHMHEWKCTSRTREAYTHARSALVRIRKFVNRFGRGSAKGAVRVAGVRRWVSTRFKDGTGGFVSSPISPSSLRPLLI